MKKITTFALIGLSAIALTACSPKSDSNSSSKGSEAKTEQSSAKKDDNVSTEFKNALKKLNLTLTQSTFQNKES